MTADTGFRPEARYWGTAQFEPSAWLRQKASDVLSRPDVLASRARGRTVAAPVTEHVLLPAMFEECKCDRCGAHTPDAYWSFRYVPQPGLIVLGGLCPDCARREGLPA